jgi:hypothetical protein
LGADSPLTPIYERLRTTPVGSTPQLPASHDFMTEAREEVLGLLLDLA